MFGGTYINGSLDGPGEFYMLEPTATTTDARRPRWTHLHFAILQTRNVLTIIVSDIYLPQLHAP